MSQRDDQAIERTTDLDLDVDELWALIATTEGWSSWLVDHADVVVAPHATGSTVDDGIVRDVRIDTVDDRRGISFSWWDRDDPSSASFVQMEIVELPDHRSRLHITEQFMGTTPTDAMSCSAGVSWDVKLVSLWLLALHSTVMA